MLSDPYRLPAWWPGVERVEEVSRGRVDEGAAGPEGRQGRAGGLQPRGGRAAAPAHLAPRGRRSRPSSGSCPRPSTEFDLEPEGEATKRRPGRPGAPARAVAAGGAPGATRHGAQASGGAWTTSRRCSSEVVGVGRGRPRDARSPRPPRPACARSSGYRPGARHAGRLARAGPPAGRLAPRPAARAAGGRRAAGRPRGASVPRARQELPRPGAHPLRRWLERTRRRGQAALPRGGRGGAGRLPGGGGGRGAVRGGHVGGRGRRAAPRGLRGRRSRST